MCCRLNVLQTECANMLKMISVLAQANATSPLHFNFAFDFALKAGCNRGMAQAYKPPGYLVLKGMLRILGSLRIKAASSPPKIGRALLTEACTKMRSACDSSFFQSARVSLISFSRATYTSEHIVSMLARYFCAMRILGCGFCAN